MWFGGERMYVNIKQPDENGASHEGRLRDDRPASWKPCRSDHDPNQACRKAVEVVERVARFAFFVRSRNK